MAKRRGRKKGSGLDAVAMAAGSTLGTIANQLDALNRKRNEISVQIRRLVRKAESQLKGMAGDAAPVIARGRKAAGKAVKTAKKVRRTMSAKARKAISDAQKKRWAAKKAGKAK